MLPRAHEALTHFQAHLDELDIVYILSCSEQKPYKDYYNQYFGPLPIGNIQVGIGVATNVSRFAPSSPKYEQSSTHQPS
ncbi:hypothetical protein S7711_11516 [Stachybotrys chartarum IBT 7711]|uniref:Uncharacterized protein n=1 Tax=Stachybotrys chartarum (strain CBS 109288 / IBT 7711) TaxID=1280523 RepID=A0A084B780_STACB|nr:hypothetical protein S7711_11516 [Stachybotrys chartarum IBT 7711]